MKTERYAVECFFIIQFFPAFNTIYPVRFYSLDAAISESNTLCERNGTTCIILQAHTVVEPDERNRRHEDQLQTSLRIPARH
jgi:hypothetical protein